MTLTNGSDGKEKSPVRLSVGKKQNGGQKAFESRKKIVREMTVRMSDCLAFGGILYSNGSGIQILTIIGHPVIGH